MNDIQEKTKIEISLKDYLEFIEAINFRDRILNINETDIWEYAKEVENIVGFIYGKKDKDEK